MASASELLHSEQAAPDASESHGDVFVLGSVRGLPRHTFIEFYGGDADAIPGNDAPSLPALNEPVNFGRD